MLKSELSIPLLFFRALGFVSYADRTVYHKHNPKNHFSLFIVFYKHLKVRLQGYQKGVSHSKLILGTHATANQIILLPKVLNHFIFIYKIVSVNYMVVSDSLIIKHYLHHSL